MFTWLKNLVKDSLVYGIGFGISRFLQIIALPIVAKALTLSEFGYYSNYVIFYTICGGFFILGLDSSVARFYYDSNDKLYHTKIFSTALYTILSFSLISIILIYFFPNNIVRIIGVPNIYIQALPYVLFTIPALMLNNFYLSWFKWKRQKSFFLINSIGTVVFLLLPLLLFKPITFLLIFKIIFYSQFIVAIISTILATSYIRLVFSKRLLWPMLKYGFPWMLVFILGISRSYLDRFFLTRYLKADSYGIYNFSVRIATILSLIITAFDMAFGPLSFSIWNKKEAPQFFARLQSSYLFLISIVACLICIGSPLLVLMLGGNKYASAIYVLPILLFSAIPLSLINFSGLGIMYAKKSFLSTLTLLIGFSSVLIFNLILTPKYFQYGAVNSSLFGHLLIVIAGYIISSKYYHISFNYIKDSIVFSGYLMLSILIVEYRIVLNIYEDIAIKTILLLILSFIIAYLFFSLEYYKILSFFKRNKYVGIGSHASL